MHTVEVTARWESSHTFEFETEEEAERFSERVNEGGNDSLEALVDAGDVDSQICELMDYSASTPKPASNWP